MRCLGCQYDLRDLTEHRCPECGSEFDPKDSTTFSQLAPPTEVRVLRFATTAAVLMLALSFVGGALLFAAIGAWPGSGELLTLVVFALGASLVTFAIAVLLSFVWKLQAKIVVVIGIMLAVGLIGYVLFMIVTHC